MRPHVLIERSSVIRAAGKFDHTYRRDQAHHPLPVPIIEAAALCQIARRQRWFRARDRRAAGLSRWGAG